MNTTPTKYKTEEILEPKTYDKIKKLIKSNPNGLTIRSEGDYYNTEFYSIRPFDKFSFVIASSDNEDVKVIPYRMLFDIEDFGSGMFYSFNLFTLFKVEPFEVFQKKIV